jgi:hypothetical protein
MPASVRLRAAARAVARCAAIAGVVLAAGCALTPSESAAAPPALAPPAALTPRAATQVIHAAFGARAVTLRTAIEVDAAALRIVGVTATGQRLFTVAWDGRAIAAERGAFVPENLDPARMLADVQLALWPLEAVRAAFRERNLEVSEPFAGVRRLRRGDDLIAEVHYAGPDPWSGRLWFVNFEFDYSLTIDTTSSPN